MATCRWIASKISEFLGSEDDVVIELCFSLLEGTRFPNIKELQINLTGFLDKDTPKFCKELWNLCLSAQTSPQGVPKELLEAKKLELIQEKIDAEKAADEARKRKEQETTRERNLDTIRQRERAERGRGRGGGRPFEPRRPRDSRSPPQRWRDSPPRGPPPRRELDSYVPRGRGGRMNRTQNRSRTRSVSPPIARAISRSRSATPRDSRPGRAPRDISSSRSRSPPIRRKRRSSTSLSPVRDERGGGRGSGRGGRYARDARRLRSISPSESSRSPSPRRRRRRSRSSSTRSRSQTPPRQHRPKLRRRSYSPFRSLSRDRLPRGQGRGGRSGRSPSHDHGYGRRDGRADIVKERNPRNHGRLSRSPDPDTSRKRRSPSFSSSRSRSRSRSRGPTKDRKRRRSLPRYAPAARRRRNTSSVSSSSPNEKRRKTADSSDEEPLRQSPKPKSAEGREDETMKDVEDKEVGAIAPP